MSSHAFEGAANGATLVNNPDVYHDIDFTQSTAAIGSSPALGGNGSTFSETRFGRVEIGVNPATGSKSAVFNTTGNSAPFYYDQVGLSVRDTQLRYYFRMDLSIKGLIGTRNGFALLFDTPTVQRLSFQSDGKITTRTGSSTTGFVSGLVGNFSESSNMILEIEADNVTGNWDVSINRNLLYSGRFASSQGLLNGVRLSLGTLSSLDAQDVRSSIYVDRVYLAVPEPSVFAAFCLSSLLMARRRRN